MQLAHFLGELDLKDIGAELNTRLLAEQTAACDTTSTLTPSSDDQSGSARAERASKRRRIQADAHTAAGAQTQRTPGAAALGPLAELAAALPCDVLVAVAAKLPQVLEQQQRLQDAQVKSGMVGTSSGEVVCGLASALQCAAMPALSEGFCIKLEHDGAVIAARLVANADSVGALTLQHSSEAYLKDLPSASWDAALRESRLRAAAVGTALSASTALQELTLHLHAACATDLLSHSTACTQLTQLSVYRLQGNERCKSDAKLAQLPKAIAVCTHLRSLVLQVELHSNKGSASFHATLAQALTCLQSITRLSLDVEDDHLGVSWVEEGRARALCTSALESINALTALQSLHLENCIVRNVEAQHALACALASCSDLQELRLGCCIAINGTKVALHLPDLLPQLRCLTRLTSMVIDESCLAYSNAAGPLPTQLQRLEISDCLFQSDAAAVAFTQYLPACTALTDLDTRGAVIALSHAGAPAATALSSLVNLTKLSLEYLVDYAHEMDPWDHYEQACAWVCACIASLPSLQDLCLQGLPVTYAGCQQFANALDAATALTRLDVKYCSLSIEDIVGLRPHVEALPSLQCLVTDLTEEIEEDICNDEHEAHASLHGWGSITHPHEHFEDERYVRDEDKFDDKVYARLCEYNEAWGPKLSELAGIHCEARKAWQAGAGRRRRARVQKQLECKMYGRESLTAPMP